MPPGNGHGGQPAGQLGARESRAAALPASAGAGAARCGARDAVDSDLVVRRRRRARSRAGQPRAPRAEAPQPGGGRQRGVRLEPVPPRPRRPRRPDRGPPVRLGRPGAAGPRLRAHADRVRPGGPTVRAAHLLRRPGRVLPGHDRRAHPGGHQPPGGHLQPDRRPVQGHLGPGLRAGEDDGAVARQRADRDRRRTPGVDVVPGGGEPLLVGALRRAGRRHGAAPARRP